MGDIPKKLAQGERFRSDEHTQKKTDNCFCAVTFVYNTSVTAPQQTPGAVLSELQKNADDFIQPRAKLCAFYCQVDDNRKTASRSLERGNQIADLHVLFAQKKKPKNLNRKKKPSVVRQGFEHEKGITRAFLHTSLVNIPSYLSNYTEVIVMALLVV